MTWDSMLSTCRGCGKEFPGTQIELDNAEEVVENGETYKRVRTDRSFHGKETKVLFGIPVEIDCMSDLYGA